MNNFGRFPRLFCTATILALASNFVMAAPRSGSAKIVQVRGVAYLGSAPANAGDTAGPGTMISTGPASELLVDLGANGGLARILENSKLSLDELTVDTGGPEPVVNTKLGLKEGKLEAQVNKLSSASRYLVQTPTSTAAIRGTIFTTYANGAVLVWDGCVDVIIRDAVTSREAKFNVCKGQMFDPSIPGVVSIPSGVMAPGFALAGGVPTAPPIGTTVYVNTVISPAAPSGENGGGESESAVKK